MAIGFELSLRNSIFQEKSATKYAKIEGDNMVASTFGHAGFRLQFLDI